MTATNQYPRRTEKKIQIRERLITAAVTLFARNGYAFTKLAEVAEEADVHVQTLYNHFKTKDELARAAAAITLEDCRAHFASAPDHQSTFQVWREWVGRTVTYLASLGFGEQKMQQIQSPSSLMNDNFLAITCSGYEDLLTEYLAKDFQLDPKHSRIPRMAACLLWSANEAALKKCAGLDRDTITLANDGRLLEESLGVVDDAEKLFAHYVK